tara:strand:+ start:414 stop:575 length:162 start_codon:yes stop_codon:yes gene_type:complete
MIGIPPSEFWDMGMPELMMAIDGFSEFHGGGEDKKDGPLTRSELDDMMERYPD